MSSIASSFAGCLGVDGSRHPIPSYPIPIPRHATTRKPAPVLWSVACRRSSRLSSIAACPPTWRGQLASNRSFASWVGTRSFPASWRDAKTCRRSLQSRLPIAPASVSARAGRMGRELAMSLTSVVLDAIAAVKEQKQGTAAAGHAEARRRSVQHSPQHQHQHPEHSGHDHGRPASSARSGLPPAQQRDPDGESGRRADAPSRHATEGDSRSRARPASFNGKRASANGVRQVVVREGAEDPGLADLDEREREFRKVGRACSLRGSFRWTVTREHGSSRSEWVRGIPGVGCFAGGQR